MELEEEVLLILRTQVKHLLAGDDGGNAAQRLVSILVGAPLDSVDVTADNESVMDGVTSRV